MSPAVSAFLFRNDISAAHGSVWRRRLRQFGLHLLSTVVPGRSCNILFTDDKELRRLNRRFLRKDRPTDVLSFAAPEANGFLGEVAISVDRAAKQAIQYGHTLEEELHILMLHGVLHLAGMDHAADAGEMAAAESSWRMQFGLPAGLTERAKRERVPA